MAVDIGPKIGIQGENEFRAQIRGINDQLKTLGTEMSATTSAFDKNDKSQKNLVAQTKILNEQITLQKDKLSQLQKGLEESTKLYGESDSRTLKWKQAVNNATTELNKMEGQLKNTNEQIKADRLEKFKDGWEKLGAAVGVTAGALAAAATAAGAAIAGAGQALAGFTADGAEYADTVLTMSTVTGIATDDLQGYQYAAGLVDVSVETLTGSMKKNLQSMSKAADGNSSMAAAYEALGVSVTNADGSLRDSETVYWELIDALGQVDDETQRNALAMDVLGKSATDLNPLILAGSDTMKQLKDEAQDAGYILSGDALTAFGEFDDQLNKLKSGTDAAKNALGTVLLPVLTDLAGDGVDLLGQFTNGILDANGDLSAMGDVISEILPQVLDMVMQYVPELIELVGTIITTVGDTILAPENMNMIIDSAVELIETLIEWVLKSLPQIIDAAIRIVTALATGLLQPENIEMLIRSTIQIVLTVGQAILENLPIILEAAAELIMALVRGIGDHLKDVAAKGREIIDTVKSAIKEKIDAAKDWGKDLIQNFIDGIKQKWEDLKQGILNIANTVKDFLGFSEPKKGPLSNFHTFAPDMVNLFIEGLKDSTSKLQSQLGESFSFSPNVSGIADVRGSSALMLDTSGFDAAVSRMGAGQNISINFEGSLSQLARVLQPVISTETKRIGTSLVGVKA